MPRMLIISNMSIKSAYFRLTLIVSILCSCFSLMATTPVFPAKEIHKPCAFRNKVAKYMDAGKAWARMKLDT